MALAGVGGAARAGAARRGRGLHNFCGHTYTTGSCPHPTGLPRVDRHGLPLRAARRRSRSTTSAARSTAQATRSTSDGQPLPTPTGAPLPPAPRTPVCAAAGEQLRLRPRRSTASWYRCCGGRVRKLMDCCALHRAAHQRRRRADRLLLRGPQRVLRHVLPDEGAVLSGADVACAALTALVAGVTGAWSPCGFSMVETLGARAATRGRARDARGVRDVRARRARRRRASRSAGSRCSGTRSAAPAARARGARARRSRWRRRSPSCAARGSSRRSAARCPSAGGDVLPLPLACGLYGVLLGLGFTTFILAFAVWALAGVSVALGDPRSGRSSGSRSASAARCPCSCWRRAARASGRGPAATAMAERAAHVARPAAPRRARAGRVRAAPEHGERRRGSRSPRATDPSAAGGALAWQRPGGTGELRRAAGGSSRCPAPTPRSAPRAWRGRAKARS